MSNSKMCSVINERKGCRRPVKFLQLSCCRAGLQGVIVMENVGSLLEAISIKVKASRHLADVSQETREWECSLGRPYLRFHMFSTHE